MDPILEVKGLYKVFGENPERAFPLIDIEVEKWSVTKQCLGLARTLAHDPAIPSMDECFSALYPSNPIEMQNKLICLHNGDVLQVGCPGDTFHTPTVYTLIDNPLWKSL